MVCRPAITGVRRSAHRHEGIDMRVRKVVTVFGFAGAIALAQMVLVVPNAGAEPNWDAMAQCESGGNWVADTGNGFYGGLQFTPSTWAAFGGTEYAPEAWQASREQQIAVAQKVQAAQGWGAWPACTSKLGLR